MEIPTTPLPFLYNLFLERKNKKKEKGKMYNHIQNGISFGASVLVNCCYIYMHFVYPTNQHKSRNLYFKVY